MKKNNDVESCQLIEKIKKSLEKHKVNVLTNYVLKGKYYLITEFMIITYDNNKGLMDIAFHISTRPDIASFFTLLLTDFDEVKDINIMEVYIKDEEGKILSGKDCILKHQENVKDTIIDDFVTEQVQTRYLQTNQVGGIC